MTWLQYSSDLDVWAVVEQEGRTKSNRLLWQPVRYFVQFKNGISNRLHHCANDKDTKHIHNCAGFYLKKYKTKETLSSETIVKCLSIISMKNCSYHFMQLQFSSREDHCITRGTDWKRERITASYGDWNHQIERIQFCGRALDYIKEKH